MSAGVVRPIAQVSSFLCSPLGFLEFSGISAFAFHLAQCLPVGAFRHLDTHQSSEANWWARCVPVGVQRVSPIDACPLAPPQSTHPRRLASRVVTTRVEQIGGALYDRIRWLKANLVRYLPRGANPRSNPCVTRCSDGSGWPARLPMWVG